MAIQNAINLTTTGVVSADGAGTFTGRTITGTADFIDVANGDGTAGNPTISIISNFETTGMHGWNGSVLETVDIGVTSDGATITFSAEKSGGGNLTAVFSTGYYTWVTAPDTVTLTAGSDTNPTLNYVYLLESNKTLTASTVSWPATEHCPLATVLCQSAASLQTELAMKNHAWTDHVTKKNNMGHIADLNFWIRQQNATYVSGIVQTYAINAVTDPDEVTIATTAGVALQLHDHTVPAFAKADNYYVVNDSVTPYLVINDLNAINADSSGATLTGRYYSLVLWIAVSEDTNECKRFVNLPSGSYNTSTGVEEDAEGYANYTIPSTYVGTGILLSEWKLRRQAASSGTFTSISEIDLRGLLPSLTAGGGTGSMTEFADNTFRIFDDGDDTKKIAFEASPITTANTRTITMLDADIDLVNVVQSASALTDYLVVCGSGGVRNTQSIASIGSAGQVLQSAGAAALPAFSTATYPLTTTVNEILYSSATNTVTGLTTGLDGVLITSHTGVPSVLAAGTTGQVLTATTGAQASWAAPATNGDVVGPGSATDDALARYAGTTGKILQDSTVLVSDNGEMTNTSQPAFLAYLPSSDLNQTGNAAIYTLGAVTAVTEVFDQNSDFTTAGVFTAPVTGRYCFNVSALVQGCTIATTIYIGIITSNRSFSSNHRRTASSFGLFKSNYIFTDMDAADTTTFQIQTSGESGNTNDIFGGGGTALWTQCSGHLVC